MEPNDNASQQAGSGAARASEELARQMQVTFDTDEVAAFFDGFAPLDGLLALIDEG